MGYEQTGSFNAMFDPAAIERAGFEITRAVGERFWLNVRDRTPIAKTPEGFSEAEFVQMRGGRKPGTARDSIYLTPAIKAFGGFEITVATDDPIFPYIEWNTQPHMIYPRNAQALRFPFGGSLTFAASVSHPGTTGQHPMQIGAMVTETEVEMIAKPIFEAALRGGSLTARL